MSDNITEDEQTRIIKAWLANNIWSIILGIGIGIGAIFGWRGYQAHTISMAKESSVMYEQVMVASQADNAAKTREHSDRLLKEYEKSPYSIYAQLFLTALDVNKNDLDSATQQLRTMLNKATTDPTIRHIIRLRLARILIAQNNIQEAEKLLKIEDTGSFDSYYAELLGDLYRHQGNNSKAQKYYEQAMQDPELDAEILTWIEMKNDALKL